MSCDYQSQQSHSTWFGQSANHGICWPSCQHLVALTCGDQWHLSDYLENWNLRVIKEKSYTVKVGENVYLHVVNYHKYCS